MNNKIVKALTAVVFLVFAAVLAFMMIQYAKEGLVTAGQKGFFALYVVLFLYALWRIISLAREIFRK